MYLKKGSEANIWTEMEKELGLENASQIGT